MSPVPSSHRPLAPARSRRAGRLETAAQRAVRWLLLTLALALAVAMELRQAQLPLAREIDANLRDAAMRLSASETGDPRLAVVDIDETSLRQLGPWPWPRARLAELAERLLSDAGATLVVFDLVLTEGERSPGGAAGDSASAGGSGAAGDDRLIAMAQARRLVAAQAFDYLRRDDATPTATGKVGGAMARAAPAGTSPAAQATGYIGNFSALARSPCIGNIGFVPDPDGRIRRIAPVTDWAGGRFPTLALAALGCLDPGLDLAALAARLPVGDAGWWALPFAQYPEGLLAVSAASVLGGAPLTPAGSPPGGASALAGRIVLVGSSALGLADRVATPLSSSAAGVTVHAAALSALLDLAGGRGRAAAPAWLMPLWGLLSIGGLWLAIGRGRLRSVSGALVLILPVWAALAGWLAVNGSVAPVSAALWGYAVLLLVHLPVEWSWAQARVRSRTRLLSRYVAKPVLDELLADGADDPLAPRRAEITVLIADMQDYTRLTSGSDLAQAAQLTKGFLEQLTRPVLDNRGTLDRYTGDGLVAFWGAPIADADHADRALDAALAILANVERFNAARAREGLPVAIVRMGIASGSALVGDLGTPLRIAYTAVGDCINLASRLQQASREVGVNILVSGSAASRCRRHPLRAIGTVPVRGLPDEAIFTP